MDRLIVVSSDCHAGLPPEKYRDYLDPKHREMFDVALPIATALTEKSEATFLLKEINDQWREGIEDKLEGSWHYQKRIEMLDGDGIASEIIFPDGVTERNTPPFGAGLSLPTKDVVPELQWAGARAHNRWLSELCSADTERHFGVAVCPLLWDVEEAVKEVRWASENGLRGIMIPLLTSGFEPYHHPKYNPFWQACEDLGIVICLHSAAAPMADFFGEGFPETEQSDYPGAVGVYVSEVFFWTYRPIISMLWGGVFERFPKLRASITETGTGWMVNPMLHMLEHHYSETHFSAKLGDYRSHLSMSPVDYFRRNCAIGASVMPRSDAEKYRDIGVGQMMWGSDYPHPEGAWPNTVASMLESFKGLPGQDVEEMLGGNAIDFYGLDREKLQSVADRIGPMRSDFA